MTSVNTVTQTLAPISLFFSILFRRFVNFKINSETGEFCIYNLVEC